MRADFVDTDDIRISNACQPGRKVGIRSTKRTVDEGKDPRHGHIHDRPGQQEHGDDEQPTFHVVTLTRPGSAFPHSVHTSDSPIG